MRSWPYVLSIILITGRVAAQACYNDDKDVLCPIVVSLDNAPYELTGAEAPVTFDLLATGEPRVMGWTAGGSNVSFLCRDVNGNGRIDNGAELFGNGVTLADGTRAKNGFIALAQFDENHDAVIDANDALWTDLLLWRDVNHDAISQPGELLHVTESALAGISLVSHWTGRRDRGGNVFRYESQVWVARGINDGAPRPVYDVFFVPVE